ncbi:hypothetical protein ACFE04_017492 [Oxalis oulophora]
MRRNHFMKVILQEAIDKGKLEIPESFLRRHVTYLPSEVTLEVENGDKWTVKLLKSDGKVWFSDGISEFMKFYSITLAYFVTFEMKGSCDHICTRIYSTDFEQIDYPSKTTARAYPNKGVETSDKDDDDPDYKTDNSDADEDSEDDNVWYVQPSRRQVTDQITAPARRTKITKRCAMSDNGAGNAVKGKRKAESLIYHQANYFKVNLLRSYVDSDYIVSFHMIPCQFARTHKLEGCERIILVGPDGREWRVACHSNGSDLRERMMLCCGWQAFVTAYKLQAGDICFFRLVKAIESTLRVSIYHTTISDIIVEPRQ